MDAQTRQILEWSGEPERAAHDFKSFNERYREATGQAFDLEPVNAKRLLTIFGNSHFLTHFLIENPLEADLLVASPAIETDKKLGDFQEEIQEILGDSSHSHEEFGRRLRLYKYREYLRLTVKDLSQAANLQPVLGEISDLAIAILQSALNFLMEEMQKEWGIPLLQEEGAAESRPCGFCVIAMGKLGGRELNYSSDVDLQYVYQSDSGGIGGLRPISNHEFFVKLSERLTRLLSQKSGDGFLYRVDLNLRPEGASGTLANSLSALEKYYETFGQEWERQALLKAVPVAGDAKLAKDFKALIDPFVWRKSLTLQVVDKMKEMKRKVHDSAAKRSTRGFHVKLDEGGIREIEFFVQTLQLLYGGTHPQIRTPNTLNALDAVAGAKLIQPTEAQQLKDAYLFLRRVEHRLQLVNEAQTHLLPDKTQEQKAVARRMGYFEDDPEKARERFMDDLTRYTALVKSIFKNLFE
ncbi:MAG: hypothetical protein U1F57_10385 [bacterium]